MDDLRFNNEDVYILWAAMQAMVNDIHAPQDNMGDAQWSRAVDVLRRLDDRVNKVEDES